MPDEIPLEPKFVACACDHCRNRIEFDAVQLAGRPSCRVPCPHCGKETELREPPPPPVLILDEGWSQPTRAETAVEIKIEEVVAPPLAEAPLAIELPIEKSLAPESEPPAAAPPPKETPAPVIEPKVEKPVAAEIEKPDVAAPPPIPPAPIEAFQPLVTEVAAEKPADISTTIFIPKPKVVSLPPDPLPPTHTRAPADVRWLTDLGVVYFRQHQFGEAFLCFGRAAEQGFATAQFCLSVCYFNGHGTARDEVAALSWLREAAAGGDANAEFALGMAYSLGRGVPVDAKLAGEWLQKAAAHGHAEAILRVGEKKSPLATPVEKIPPPEKSAEKRRHDLQRLVLGLFKKK